MIFTKIYIIFTAFPSRPFLVKLSPCLFIILTF